MIISIRITIAKTKINMEHIKDNAELFEQQYVHTVYDQINSEFDRSRYAVWPSVRKFIHGIFSGEVCSPKKILEVGSGNCKNLNYISKVRPQSHLNIETYGCDLNEEFIKIGTKNGHNMIKANAIMLPYEDLTFDHVLNIAPLN